MAGWVKKEPRGTIKDVKIVLGAVAPTAIRAKEAEAFLKGKPCSDVLIAEAAKIAGDECNPITDVRATENGRRLLVEAWAYRLLQVLTN
jgi:carbon-monoxide dehydrogenase medium subunit